jgi:hypothetical protein
MEDQPIPHPTSTTRAGGLDETRAWISGIAGSHSQRPQAQTQHEVRGKPEIRRSAPPRHRTRVLSESELLAVFGSCSLAFTEATLVRIPIFRGLTTNLTVAKASSANVPRRQALT